VRVQGEQMRVLVTGATGFIGGHLATRLVALGHEVTALVRSPGRASHLEALGITLLAGDLSLFADPSLELAPADVVIHLAGVVSAPDAATYEAINYTAVEHLVACLERQAWAPERLVFASSLAAAGPSSGQRPLTEADPLAPIEPYGEAKARAEGVLAGASFPTTSFRPPPVFGGGDPAFLPVFKLARAGVGFRVGRRPQRLSWIHVHDLVQAIVALVDDRRPGHHAYFTTSEHPIDTDELWAALGRAYGHRVRVLPVPGRLVSAAATVAMAVVPRLGLTNPLDHKQVAQMRAPAFVCTSAALTAHLGWRAEVGFDDAIARTLAGYRSRGWL
jgi:dihydroflavonol-4-reductase